MDSELTFLISLLLNDSITKDVKELLKDRIKEVEQSLRLVQPVRPVQVIHPVQSTIPVMVGGVQQSASTARILAEMAQKGNLLQSNQHGHSVQSQPASEAPIAPQQVVASPAAAQALASRQQAISQQVSGKPEPGRTSPRKF